MESSNIIVGEKSNISIKLLDENDNPVVSELDIPLSISTNLGYVPSYILLHAGTESSVIEYSSEVSGIAIISVKSKGLIGDTGSIAVMPLPSPTIGTIEISSGPPGARVYLDGSYKGETPKVITDVPQGYHRIELKLSGFFDWSNTFYVAPGVSLSVSANLKEIPPPGGGSGTGGSGVSYPADDPANIGAAQSFDVDFRAGVEKTVTFTNPDLWIQAVTFIPLENEIGVRVLAQIHKGRSKNVPLSAPGTQYMALWVSTKKIKEGVISFRVPNSWLVSEGIMRSSDVRMYRWTGSMWEALETTDVSKDEANTYYEARTTAFSYFAISGAAVTPTAAVPWITPTPPPVSPIASTEQSTISILVYVLILFMVMGMYYYFDIKGKK